MLTFLMGFGFIQALVGWIKPLLDIVAAVVVPIIQAVFSMLRSLKFTIDGVVVAFVVLGCAVGGWLIAKHSRAVGQQMEIAANEKAMSGIKTQVTTYVKIRNGQLVDNKANRDKISSEIRAIIDAIPPDKVTERVEIPGKTEYIHVPFGIPSVFGNKTEKVKDVAPGKTTSAPFQPDYPRELRDAINKINVNK